jgi:uncharacterized damage-inducible protein DinB
MNASRVAGLTAAIFVALATQSNAQPRSLGGDLSRDWTSQMATMMATADAMPADTFAFKPTDAQRDFGQQILHVAGANVGLMGVLGSAATAPTINQEATDKAAILEALNDSFDYGAAVLETMSDAELQERIQGPAFMGEGTRTRFVYRAMMHTEDIYGQMVVYLRLNGIVPPASRP